MRFERRSFRGREGFRSGGFSGFREDNIPKPVNVGEEYDVEINEVGSKGDGIARVKNFVVFVSNGRKGEKTKIKIKEVRNRFAIGEKVGEAAEETAETAGEKKAETEEETGAEEETEGEEKEETETEGEEKEETETEESEKE